MTHKLRRVRQVAAPVERQDCFNTLAYQDKHLFSSCPPLYFLSFLPVTFLLLWYTLGGSCPQ